MHLPIFNKFGMQKFFLHYLDYRKNNQHHTACTWRDSLSGCIVCVYVLFSQTHFDGGPGNAADSSN